MTLGEKIARQRKELNYTQDQLAEILGVSRQSVSKWESDITYPETEKLIELGKLFDCSMDYLLKEEITEKNGIQISIVEKVVTPQNKEFLKKVLKIIGMIFLGFLLVDMIALILYISIKGLPF